MIRIWNYNKNRIHSYRGARYLEMYIEDQHTRSGGSHATSVIFRGEIRRAPGGVFESYEDCCECILFTTNPVVLSLIEKYDPLEDATDTSKLAPVPYFLQNSSSSIETLEPSSNHLSATATSDKERTSKNLKFSPSLLLSPSPSYHHISSTSANGTGGHSSVAKSDVKFGQQELLDEFGGWDPGNLNRPTTGKRNQSKRPPLPTTASESVFEPQSSEHDPSDYLPVPLQKNPPQKIIPSLGNEDVLSISFDSLPAHLTTGGFSKTVSFKSPLQHQGSAEARARFGHSSPAPYIRPSTALASRQHEPIRASTIVINILSNWGDCNRVGLSGVSALDANFSEISLPAPLLIVSNSTGLSKLPTPSNSQLTNLISGSHLTTDPRRMWSVPYDLMECGVISLRFELISPILLRGLRIWNYNGDNEDTWVGVRHVDIYLEQKRGTQQTQVQTQNPPATVMYDGVSPTAILVGSRLVLRKAPGEADLEYAQFIHLNGQDQPDTASETRTLRSQRNNSTSDLSREFGEDTGYYSPSVIIPEQRAIPIVCTSASGDMEEMHQPLSPDSAAINESGTCLVNQQYETPVYPSLPFFLILSPDKSLRLHAEVCAAELPGRSLLHRPQWNRDL